MFSSINDGNTIDDPAPVKKHPAKEAHGLGSRRHILRTIIPMLRIMPMTGPAR